MNEPRVDPLHPAQQDDAGISTVARRGTLNLVGASISGLLSFALVVIVTRTMHTVGAGLFFEATSVFILAATVAKFGSDTALVRFISHDRAKGVTEHIRRHIMAGVVPSAFFALITGALLFWLAPELASYFEITPGLKHNPELARMIRVLAVFLPIYVTYLNGLAATVGFGSMVPINVVDRFMTSALQPVAVFIAADLALGAGMIVAAWAAPILLGLIPICLWLRRLAKKAGVCLGAGGSPHTVPGTPGKDFWLFAGPRGVASIFQIGQDRVGILLVGALNTAAGAGVFAAAARWLIAGGVFNDALNLGIQPTMAEHFARRDYASAGRLYQVTTGWVVLVSGPIYLVMSIFPAILLRPFGHGFDDGALALTILAIGALAGAVTGSVTVILLMGGKSSWNLFNTSVALGADVVIGILLIPHLGLIGAAISTDVGVLIANVLPVIQVHRFYRMHPFGKGFWVAMTASLGCFVLIGVPIRLVVGQSLPAVLTYALLSCSAYALVLWLKRDALQLTRLFGMVSGQLRWLGHAGRYRRIAVAIPVIQLTLAARERVLGPDHPYTVASRNKLASAYRDAGRISEAIPLIDQTLTARERMLCADHPGTLSSRNNLAVAYRHVGRVAEAIPLFERNLAACERLLGADHPKTLSTRNNLAACHEAARAEGAGHGDEKPAQNLSE